MAAADLKLAVALLTRNRKALFKRTLKSLGDDLESLSFFPDSVLLTYFTILENQLHCIARPKPHLLDLGANHQTGGVFFHGKGCKSPAPSF